MTDVLQQNKQARNLYSLLCVVQIISHKMTKLVDVHTVIVCLLLNCHDKAVVVSCVCAHTCILFSATDESGA